MPHTASHPTEDSIRAIAYGLWLEEGRPEGRAEAHWLRAYELVSSESVALAPPKKTAVAAKKTTRRKVS